MKKIIFFIVYYTCIHQLSAQQLTIDISTPHEMGSINAYDPSKLGAKSVVLTYADIDGSAFWKDDWQKAYMYTKAGNVILLDKAKMNLYTGELHYIAANGTELVTATEAVSKIVFMQQKEDTKVDAVFAVLANYVDSKPAAYFKVFNAGDFQLILLEQRKVKTSPYDPIQGKSVSAFFSKNSYALYSNGRILPLKDLDKASLLAKLPNNVNYEAWLKEHKNKLRNEADVISFLNYVNTL